MTARVVVTGGSGKLGRACVADLVDHGYAVVNIDLVPPHAPLCPFVRADLTDMGQVMEVLHQVDDRYEGVDAVVHLAAVPAPGLVPGAQLFHNNTTSTYNVFAAARHFGVRNVVSASSETVLGLPFDTPPPYVPVDEEYAPRPESTYSLSKVLGETMAAHFCRWDGELKIASLRFSNVMAPDDYRAFPAFQSRPEQRKWNLWSYIDARDAAQAVRKSLEAPFTGAEAFIIGNADSVMNTPSRELMERFFPTVEHRRPLEGTGSLFSIDKARRVLGYQPEHSWRQASGAGA